MSTTEKNLLGIYSDILATVRYTPNSEGFIMKSIVGNDEEKSQVIVGGKALVFPNDLQLSQPDWAKRFAFHPMREDFSSGFSPVFEDYRRRMSHTLSFHAGFLMLSIADMATKDGAYQKSLPQNVADYLLHVKDGDTKFKEVLLGIMAADPTKHRAEMEWVRINVQKGRKIGNEQRKRAAMVSFPILEKVLSHSKDNKVDRIAGVALRGKDREMLRSLYKLVFPMAETPDAYMTWSDSMQAPSMDALMRCAAPMIERINEVAANLSAHAPGTANVIISYNWRPVFDNLDAYTAMFNSIPMLNGNSGAGRVIDTQQPITTIKLQTPEEVMAATPTDGRTVAVAQPTAPAPIVVQPAVVQPVVLNQPAVQPVVTSTAFHLDQPMINTATPATGSMAAFRLDGPRGGALAPAAVEQPVQTPVVKHDPVTPTQITQQAQPLFGNVPQPAVPTVTTIGGVPQQVVQQQVPVNMMPGAAAAVTLPQGQPQVVNTAAGQVFVYPNGQSFTAQQVAVLQAQQQQAANMAGLTAMGNNPVMQQLLAMNPQNAFVAAAAQMSGGMMPGGMMVPGMMMPGMMMPNGMMMQTPQAQTMATRMGGMAYQPLTQVNQVIPGYGGF